MRDAVWLVLAGLGMFAVGLGSVLWWARRKPGLVVPALLGVAAWAVGVALKFAWAVPTNRGVLAWFATELPAWAAGPARDGYLGLLTGIFECGVVLLVVRRSRLRDADFDGAVAFGLGKGGGEAVVLAAVTGLSALAVGVAGSMIPPDKRELLHAAAGAAALRPVERLFALAAHTFSSVLIVYAVRRRQWRWFWAGFLYLSAVDAFASWALATWGKSAVMDEPVFWLGLLLFALAGAAGTWALRGRFPTQETAS